MKKKTLTKRLTALLVTFAMIFSFLPAVNAAEAPEANYSAETNKASVQRGDEITVSINLSENSYMAAFNAEVGYDPDVLEYVKLTKGEVLKAAGGSVEYNPTEGMLKYGYISTGPKDENDNPIDPNWPGITDGGNIFNVIFKVKDAAKAGKTDIDLNVYSSTTADRQPNRITSEGTAVTVEAPLKSISLDKSALTINENASEQLNVIYNPEDTTADKTVKWTSSNPTVATVSEGLVKGIAAGTATVTAVVGDKTASCTVTVNKVTAKAIAVKTLPTKLDYIEGQELDVAGGTLDVTMSDGTTKVIDMTKDMCSVDMNKTGEQTVTVSYGGQTTSFKVNIAEKTLTVISMESNPTQVEYITGKQKDINVEGGKVKLTYDNGKSEIVDLTKEMCSVDNLTVVGTHKVTVTYKGKTTSFDIKVLDKSLTEIKVTTKPSKTTYIEGQAFDVTGGKLDLVYDNNTTDIVDLTADMCSGYDMNKTGQQDVKVTYNGKTTTFQIIVNEKTVKSLALLSAPRVTEYIEGKTLNTAGGRLDVSYDNGTSEQVSLTADMCSGMDMNKAGTYPVKITYKNGVIENAFSITVKPVPVAPENPAFNEKQEAASADGQKIEVSASAEEGVVEEGAGLKVGEPEQDMGVIEAGANAVVGENSKILAAVNIQLVKDGIVLQPDGSLYIKIQIPEGVTAVASLCIIHFDKDGNETVLPTVIENGYALAATDSLSDFALVQAQGEVATTKVIRNVTGIQVIAGDMKTEYKLGDEFTVAGGKLKVSYDYGDDAMIDMTTDMCSGYDMSKVGKQNVKVRYEGQTAAYDIIVSPVPAAGGTEGKESDKTGKNPATAVIEQVQNHSALMVGLTVAVLALTGVFVYRRKQDV